MPDSSVTCCHPTDLIGIAPRSHPVTSARDVPYRAALSVAAVPHPTVRHTKQTAGRANSPRDKTPQHRSGPRRGGAPRLRHRAGRDNSAPWRGGRRPPPSPRRFSPRERGGRRGGRGGTGTRPWPPPLGAPEGPQPAQPSLRGGGTSARVSGGGGGKSNRGRRSLVIFRDSKML